MKTRIKEKLLTDCNLHTVVRLPNGVFNPYTGIKTNLLFFTKGEKTKDVWFYEHPYPPGCQVVFNKTKPMRIEEFEPEKEWWKKRRESEFAWKVSFKDIKAGGFNLDIKNPHSPDNDLGDPDELLKQYKALVEDTAGIREKLKAELINALGGNAWQRICDNFDMLFGNPENITKLRQAILQLAVRGKLVKQDPKDEPAFVLLEKIRAEKEELIISGKIRKSKPLSDIKESEKPFKLPESWEWARLGDIGDTNIGLTYSPKDISDHGIPVLRANNIQNGKLILSDLVKVDVEPPARVLVKNGDLLICARSGSPALVGKAAIIDRLEEKTAFGAFMAIFRCRLNAYVYYFILSPIFRQVIDDVHTTTINQITQGNLKSALIPVPPIDEQKRIVAKVDQLMALCDDLEARLIKGQVKSGKLLEAAVADLLAT